MSLHVHTHVYINVHTHKTCAHTHTHTCAHTHTHTHTHYLYVLSAVCRLLAAALYRPRIGCAVLAACVSAAHRLFVTALYQPRVGSAVSAACTCRLFAIAKVLYRPHQQRHHVGRTELRRVGRTPPRTDNVWVRSVSIAL